MTAADASADEFETLLLNDGSRLAYVRSAGAAPGLVFVGGFRSDMTGAKARRFEAFGRGRGLATLRFDPFGHGRSTGRFEDGVVSRWAGDLVAALDRLTDGPQILIGSSMGAWLVCLAMRPRAPRIAAFLGIAAAPDFTEELIAPKLSAAQRFDLETRGVVHLPSAYGDPTPITRQLIEDGRAHLVLRRPIAFAGPVRLVHGMADADVPYACSLRLADAFRSRDVRITLIKDGEHRLSRDRDLLVLERELAELIDGRRPLTSRPPAAPAAPTGNPDRPKRSRAPV